ncbi:hypothetical protein FNV43_RR00996 [Rhamnella rubrinervis]|uniref:INO80 complex subunit B-like conserved region domain-containing protein n=1 Tax=Rhamnella rubrinervis TaxID=2594499 RepID=A0A8K0HNT8_9ROSA|nr:hypothetical protein FNV43_RR00996 [Rhamnella rubrinervis]
MLTGTLGFLFCFRVVVLKLSLLSSTCSVKSHSILLKSSEFSQQYYYWNNAITMESVDGCGIRKKRSNPSRRPRLDSHTLLQSYYIVPPTQPFSNVIPDKNHYNRDKVVVSDGLGSENKLKKLKLKVGGVTHTIHTKSTSDFVSDGGSSIRKSPGCFSAFTHQEKSHLQDDVDGNHSCSLDKGKGFGVKWKDISKTDPNCQKEHSLKGRFGENVFNESVRKSKRVSKRRILDVEFGEDSDEDKEIRYLGRYNASKVAGDGIARRSQNQRKHTRIRTIWKKKNQHGMMNLDLLGRSIRGSPNLYSEGQKESTPTTRNRAIQYGRDNLDGSSESFVDLSACLLPSKSRKKKEKLSELELQLKKAEAAQRRKMQSEKAAQEAEAEAIRKILGQDSRRKKREEKMQKLRDEVLQGKAANALLASNTIRWVNGLAGTVITFSEDIGLPSIFNPVPCSYPPPREKCAGPNCTNAYKYRDSKSKLPLCSLDCYKAVHEKMQPLVAC